MKKFKIILAYDGTRYSGWQKQLNSTAIQEILEKALQTTVIGAGRTDAGVHALGQVAHFSSEKMFSIEEINSLLPADIRVLSLEEVPVPFHSRFSATSKIYHYHICTEPPPPHKRRFTHLCPYINIDLVKEGAKLFIGTHDFSSFTNEAGRSDDHVRTIYRLDVKEEEGIRLEFEGDGFLYKMVRNITGTLLKASSLEEIRKVIALKDRRESFDPAPPQGLFLVKVLYELNPLKTRNGKRASQKSHSIEDAELNRSEQ